jgi:hypothetical protein
MDGIQHEMEGKFDMKLIDLFNKIMREKEER